LSIDIKAPLLREVSSLASLTANTLGALQTLRHKMQLKPYFWTKNDRKCPLFWHFLVGID